MDQLSSNGQTGQSGPVCLEAAAVWWAVLDGRRYGPPAAASCLLQAVLNVRVWVEWIDSASNPADGLSRGGLEDSWTQQQGWLLTEGAQPPWSSLKEAPERLWRVFNQTLGTN